MTGLDLTAGILLALQVWDGFGWLGQALFTLRVLLQWGASERAGRSVVPHAFWWMSLGGSLALIVYVVHRQDPVFLAGVSINTAIYVRNLRLVYRRHEPQRERLSPWVPVACGLGIAAVAAFTLTKLGLRVTEFDQPLWSLALGFTAQTIWSSRFVLQWYASERAGRSVLPASFFYISTLGAMMLFAYAVVRVDWVMMAAYVLNPIPYIRNIVLLRRERASAA